MVTITHLLRAEDSQMKRFDILQRADRIFWVQRYYNGPLEQAEIDYLTE